MPPKKKSKKDPTQPAWVSASTRPSINFEVESNVRRFLTQTDPNMNERMRSRVDIINELGEYLFVNEEDRRLVGEINLTQERVKSGGTMARGGVDMVAAKRLKKLNNELEEIRKRQPIVKLKFEESEDTGDYFLPPDNPPGGGGPPPPAAGGGGGAAIPVG
jgi:hypothetical protein